jgi:hypothetical protein
MNKFLPIITLFISLTSFAQTKFIEVEVRDTIMLKIESFDYFINIENEPIVIEEDEPFDGLAYEENYKQRLNELKMLLQSNKIQYKEAGNTGGDTLYPPLSQMLTNGVSVTLKNKHELDELQKSINRLNYAHISLEKINYINDEKDYERLIKKNLDKARSRATVIATHSGLKLGKILEVRESGEDDATESIYESYFKTLLKPELGFTNAEDSTLKKKMVVKFAVE